jgi:hypothetical protein
VSIAPRLWKNLGACASGHGRYAAGSYATSRIMAQVTVIPLEFWQDPQGDVILVFSEHECSVYFGCWSSAGEPADFIGHLSFQSASAARSFDREFLPYRAPKHEHRSYILSISDSEFIREHIAYRRQHYPGSRLDAGDRVHYVVAGHDIYHEILAASFAATKIPKQEVTDGRLRRLIDAP